MFVQIVEMLSKLCFFLVQASQDFIKAVFDEGGLLLQEFADFVAALGEEVQVVVDDASGAEQHGGEVGYVLLDRLGYTI